MSRRTDGVVANVGRLWKRLRGEENTGESEKSVWRRSLSLLQVLIVVGAAFGGAIASTASTALDASSALFRSGGSALLDSLWPVLLGVTLVAVVVCAVVVVLGIRNA